MSVPKTFFLAHDQIIGTRLPKNKRRDRFRMAVIPIPPPSYEKLEENFSDEHWYVGITGELFLDEAPCINCGAK
jgi:hypothetical protein